MNWDSIRDETVALLQNLIRFNTTNPPGDELACVQYIADVLKREGIESQIFEAAPGRGNLVARLKGNGSQQPFIFMGHVDVVPAEADKWTYPPFGGEIHNGFLYGRGALDMKGVDAIEIMTFILLKRMNVLLARDVILEINADEEMGGFTGAKWMMDNHPDLIHAEYGLTEFGGNPVPFMGKEFFGVQTGEKGGSGFILRTHGTPGHGSMPHPDNAILKLAAALHKLGAAELPAHVTDTMRTYIETIAAHVGPEGEQLLGLLDPATFAETFSALPLAPGVRKQLHSQFHNSIAPTILQAGTKTNVIPSVAECNIDCRIVPGQTQADVEREVRAVLGDSVELEFRMSGRGIEASPKSPLFETIQQKLTKHHFGAIVIPFLQTGGTDARYNVQLGTQIYGFTPTLAPIAEFDRVHAHDERIRISDIEFGVKVLYDVVSDFCAV
jgi:acetylornithine deacetylase/succinyl-diaminopimelate desuccinylase-like protein